MKKCIICREEKDNMSDEHVIPDSLGGYYHIKTVCRDCNSHLGTKVDIHLVDNKFSQIYRSKYSIKGKKGNIPNPLADTFISTTNSNMKATYKKNSDGTLEPYYMPLCEVEKNIDGEITGLTISLDDSEKDNHEEYLKKILNRNKLSLDNIVSSGFQLVPNEGTYRTTWSMDFHKMKIGALKIAYEFAVDKVPEYFNDPCAVKISEILKQARVDEANSYVNIGNGLSEGIIKPFEPLLEFEKNKHYLILSSVNESLFCLVRIHDVYTIGVTLSDKKYLSMENSIIGINDFENKTFSTKTLSDIIYDAQGELKLNFLFKGVNINKQEYKFRPYEYFNYSNTKDLIPLYDEHGTCITYLHEITEKVEKGNAVKHELSKVGSSFIIPIKKPYKLHVKSAETQVLYEVDAVEMHQTWKMRH